MNLSTGVLAAWIFFTLSAVCVQAQTTQCDWPDFGKATLAVVNVSPTSAVLRVDLRPLLSTTNGWSIALMFAKTLPQSLGVQSGQVMQSASSADSRIFTFNSLNYNGDISAYGVYSVFLSITFASGSADVSNFPAIVGFYNKIVIDASCIQTISPVDPLPTTEPPSTISTTTATTESTSASTTSTTSPAAPTTTTTTTQSTTTQTTTTAPTTTTTQASTSGAISNDDCEVLSNDGEGPGYLIINNGWREGSIYKFQFRAQKYPDEKGPLASWTMKIEFSQPVSAIEVWIATAHGPYQDGRVWLLKPKDYNDGIGNGEGNDPLLILAAADISGGDAAAAGTVTFCRNGAEPDLNLGGGSVTTTSMATNAATTTTTGVPSPRCADISSSSFGGLPPFSGATDPTSFAPSTVTAATMFDYNEVLHMSILFYEAQRSGKLPTTSRILWRGDSGLKDGCDVGLDLAGGYYDAGDNVKFGFPMAYAATVLAWGLIEFEDSYSHSGDLGYARDMIKWFSDYFVKAHASKFELYVQVGDPDLDHSTWLRPEDVKFVRKSYKIDPSNPGTEVAAETAAALAAASIVLRAADSGYADMLLLHARDLFEFADNYRESYHISVPSVTNFYKSWSGFNDELLWAAAWMYKATGDQTFLSYAENNYDSYGGGNTPGEFSWDNKHAGVQVLLAQITKTQKYRDHVDAFYTYIKSVPTTPLGLTWKLKWGPNRYAANFAWISTMAAKLSPHMPRRSEYLTYAKKQINYILGINEKGSSYVVGHMTSSPQRPHHRSSSCPAWQNHPVAPCTWNAFNNPGPNPHVLYGALVGGPDQNGNYADDRNDFVKNEVALDYNAGFQSTLAGLQHFALMGDL